MHQLLYAVSVAHFLNFSNAADHLYITQPTLSQQIKKLEQEIGFTIFFRNTKSVSLTASGVHFIRQAERVVEEYQNLQNMITDWSLLKSGNIKVGMPPLLDNQDLMASLGEFSKRYPNISFEFVQTWSSELIDQLISGNIDIAMVIIPPDEKELQSVEFYSFREDNVMLLMDPNHPLAAKTAVTLADISGEKILLGSRSSAMKTSLAVYYQEQGIIPNFVYGMGDPSSIHHLVANGFGISFSVSMQSNKHIVENLLAIPLSPPIKHRIAIASNSKKKLSAPVRMCIEHIMMSLYTFNGTN